MSAAVAVGAFCIVCASNAWAPVCIGLCIAAHLLLVATGVPLSVGLIIPLMLVIFAAPAAAYLAGVLLDKFVVDGRSFETFRTFGAALGFLLLFSLDSYSDFLADTVLALQSGTVKDAALVVGALVSNIILCAGVIAVAVMVLQLTFELPIWWLLGVGKVSMGDTVRALRSLMVVALLALSFQLALGFFGAELWPFELIKSLRH